MNETKYCTGCTSTKATTEFHKNRSMKDGLYARCKVCVNRAGEKYRQANLEKSRAWGRKAAKSYRAKNPDKVRANNLRLRFDLTPEAYEKLLRRQNGVCATCLRSETLLRHGKPQSLSVDHDHKTGKVRGLLCNQCNRALGLLEYRDGALLGLASYVEGTPPEIPAIPEVRSSLSVFDQERTSQLKYDFQINISQYRFLEKLGGGVCWACKAPETSKYRGEVRALAVDHDHKSGRVRGLLCLSCNRALGAVDDSPERLRALYVYLTKWEAAEVLAA